MPRFVSFPGLRYAPARVPLPDVIAPPYDVIGPAEQAELEARSPYNAIHVELPRADGDVYQAAAQRFEQWIADGVLVADAPSLYAYEMEGTDEFGAARRTRGVFGALAIAEGGVLPHEQTTPKAKSDRLDLLRATWVNTSPIWVLTPTALSGALENLGAPDAEAVDDDGIAHRLWVLSQDAADHVTKLLAEEPVLVADGHHRYETAKNYRAEQQAVAGDGPAGHDLVLALAVELAEDQLAVGAIHRLISDATSEDILEVLHRHFVLTPTAPVSADIGQRMVDAGALAVITADGTWLAEPTGVTIESALMDLDSSRLDVALADLSNAAVVYQHGCARVHRSRHRRRSERGGSAAAGHGGPDRRGFPRRRSHAAEDHVLLAEAAHRHGLPAARLMSTGVNLGFSPTPCFVDVANEAWFAHLLGLPGVPGAIDTAKVERARALVVDGVAAAIRDGVTPSAVAVLTPDGSPSQFCSAPTRSSAITRRTPR